MENVCSTLSMLDNLLEEAQKDRPNEPRVQPVEPKDVEFVLPMSETVLV